jgi:hypothetical protein
MAAILLIASFPFVTPSMEYDELVHEPEKLLDSGSLDRQTLRHPGGQVDGFMPRDGFIPCPDS